MAVASMKDWLATNRLLPSWVLSGLFHAALVALLLWLMPFQERAPVGDTLEPSREIGIFVKERGVLVEPQEGSDVPDPTNVPSESTPAPQDPLTPTKAVPDSPVITAPLPQAESSPSIGPGAASPQGLPDPKELIKGKPGGKGLPGVASGGMPGTAFMGIKDHGTRVVYVVDCSGSMYQHNAMGKAKAALVASLNALDPGQQFQIIFYNETPRVMSLKSTPKKQMYFATDLNKSAAHQFIDQVDPDLGTEHLTAIVQGLRFTPEVMYVLTDSGQPILSPSELDKIQRTNGGRTRIHCIEFGVGKELNGESVNFLKKLAKQNDGTHRYVDVTESGKR